MVNKKNNTKTNTKTPAVAILNTAEKKMPTVVLTILKATPLIRVFLKDRFNFKAQSPGITISATTRIVPITFMDNTIVMATSRSNTIDNFYIGIPIILESSSSKTIDSNSLLKSPMNPTTVMPKTETSIKSM